MSAIGKRRGAVLAVLAARGRSTSLDVLRCARREHGVTLSDDGVRGLVVALEDEGHVEPAEPHLDRAGRLRGTWKLTDTGRALAGANDA